LAALASGFCVSALPATVDCFFGFLAAASFGVMDTIVKARQRAIGRQKKGFLRMYFLSVCKKINFEQKK
jgi:hypothetical protein